MLILIEGADNTGKTTLAKMLCSQIGAYYHHCGKPQSEYVFEEYEHLYLDKLRDYENVVMDRGHLGEYVYSQLWRGGLSMEPDQFSILTAAAEASFRGLLVVHAKSPVDVIIERCRKNGEDLLQEDQVGRCVELFDEIILETQKEASVFLYDSSKMLTSEAVPLIIERANRIRW